MTFRPLFNVASFIAPGISASSVSMMFVLTDSVSGFPTYTAAFPILPIPFVG